MATILVADDSASMRAMARSILQEAGHVVHLVENGRLAVRFLEQQAVDVVLLDIFMPEMDGFEAIQAIRGMSPDTPIVTMSSGGASGDMRYLRMARGLGAFECVRKPLDPNVLRAAVEQALRSKIRLAVTAG